jgi:hypothetical protein
MDRLFTRRGVLIGASASAASLVAVDPVEANAVDRLLLDKDPGRNRVALIAIGSLELPDRFLGGEQAIARSRDINCRLYLAPDGQLHVDDLNYEGDRTTVQLTMEQHADLLAAFTRHSSPLIQEVLFHEPVQPKGGCA